MFKRQNKKLSNIPGNFQIALIRIFCNNFEKEAMCRVIYCMPRMTKLRCLIHMSFRWKRTEVLLRSMVLMMLFIM
ncbi:hypothetical protein WM40_05565 [Robbsia andropogonis]|uniref:Uncharacterized protein n=1 Tax=Robbsia andropogonis TaxID=28092 RepID=A0A0F5K4D1_9BURK|nr:hypothetical protein WM40_05565 [Robbsia andropogonis]